MRIGIFVAVVLLMVGSVRAEGVGDARADQQAWKDQQEWKGLVRQWEGRSMEVQARERGLALASQELGTIEGKVKILPASPELKQLLMDSAARRAAALF